MNIPCQDNDIRVGGWRRPVTELQMQVREHANPHAVMISIHGGGGTRDRDADAPVFSNAIDTLRAATSTVAPAVCPPQSLPGSPAPENS
jgi:hypothetical protein